MPNPPPAGAPTAPPAGGFDLAGAPARVVDWRNYARHTNPTALGNIYPARSQPVSRLVIHHFGNLDPNRSFAEANAEVIDLPHLPYHLGIDPDGTLYWFNHLWERVPHCGDADESSIAIVLHGNFNTRLPSPEQLRSLQWLVTALQDYLSLKRESVVARSELGSGEPNAGSPGSKFAPAVIAYRTGTDFTGTTPPAPPSPTPHVRFRVFNPRGEQVQANNGIEGMVLRAENERGYVVEPAPNRICLDLRGYIPPTNQSVIPWTVFDANGKQTGRYRMLVNAVKDAAVRKGWGISTTENNKRRIEFREGESL